jgi:hypothetical protein
MVAIIVVGAVLLIGAIAAGAVFVFASSKHNSDRNSGDGPKRRPKRKKPPPEIWP